MRSHLNGYLSAILFALMLCAGNAGAEVARLLGHKDPSVTLKVYTHFIHPQTSSVQDFASAIFSEQQR